MSGPPSGLPTGTFDSEKSSHSSDCPLKRARSNVDTCGMPGPLDPPHAMLLTLLQSIALLGAATHSMPLNSTQVPTGQLLLPGAIRAADVPASIQITATHFMAKSLVNERQWLVFMNQSRGLVRVRGLRPFESALLPIPAGGADGMSIEVLARSAEGRLLSSGVFRCTALASTKSAVFLERTPKALIGWTPRHGGRSLTRVSTKPSALVPTLASASAAQPVAPHVPIPVPAENRTRDKSRKLNKKKLPPI